MSSTVICPRTRFESLGLGPYLLRGHRLVQHVPSGDVGSPGPPYGYGVVVGPVAPHLRHQVVEHRDEARALLASLNHHLGTTSTMIKN